jgi:hypothetical protein
MSTNEQFQQPDGTPPGFPFNTAEEPHAKKSRRPGEKAAAANPPEVALAQLAEPVALAMTPPPQLANRFASWDAVQTKNAFTDLSESIRDKSEAFEGAFKDAANRWDELTPCLSQMQSLLSQRGEQRRAVLREAGLPGWTEWFEGFKKELSWKISLRAVQKKLAALRDKGTDRAQLQGPVAGGPSPMRKEALAGLESARAVRSSGPATANSGTLNRQGFHLVRSQRSWRADAGFRRPRPILSAVNHRGQVHLLRFCAVAED